MAVVTKPALVSNPLIAALQAAVGVVGVYPIDVPQGFERQVFLSIDPAAPAGSGVRIYLAAEGDATPDATTLLASGHALGQGSTFDETLRTLPGDPGKFRLFFIASALVATDIQITVGRFRLPQDEERKIQPTPR